ncbi:MAG: hypothetical protein R3F20_16295 [Planctomycetota bacterium]
MPAPELDHGKVRETIELLANRITERFPDSGLGRLASHTVAYADELVAIRRGVVRPIRSLRVAVVVLVASFFVPVAVFLSYKRVGAGPSDVWSFVQAFDSLISILVFGGAAMLFLTTIETRIKRKRVLEAVHRLRSLAHVVDMHQLTKDPEVVLMDGPSTQSSPRRELSAFELSRYLDYCCELLSLLSKLGAILVERFNDAEALAAVDRLEDMTTGLSRKIWQKLMILNRTQLDA